MIRVGGKRRTRRRRGGNAIGRAVVPFGLFAMSNYLGKSKKRKSRRGTRRGDRRKTARRAYMK